MLYNEKMKRWNDAKILNQEFHVGDDIVLFNSILTLFVKKLRSKWSGPFVISNVYPSGAIELEDHEKKKFVANVQRLKHYYMGGPGATKPQVRSIWSTDLSREAAGILPQPALDMLKQSRHRSAIIGIQACLQGKTFCEKLEKGNAPNKGKAKATFGRNKSSVAQAINNCVWEIGKEVNQILFGVEAMKELYDEWSYPWLSRVIAKGLPPWANGVGQIKRRDLSIQAKQWLGFIDQQVICIDVSDITQCKYEDNPTDLKRKALVLIDSGVEGFSSSEGVEIPLNSTLDAETHQYFVDTPPSLITTPLPRSVQSAWASTVTFAKAAIAPLRDRVAKLEQKVTTLEAMEDCEGVASMRADLDSLWAKIHFGQPSFGLDEAEITFSLETSGPLLPFNDLLGEGHENIDDEVEVDLVEGLPEVRQVELAMQLSRDKEHARIVGASSSTRYDNESPFIADSMRGAQSYESSIETGGSFTDRIRELSAP
ncbi:hypothetical protein BC332_15806 [Capsicum chinense]|nr:hypothetical protein BC332_15806 [Capsicum chinense]